MKTFFLLLGSLLVAVAACQADDDSTVLLPIGNFRMLGAYGSVWQTELAANNTSDIRFFVLTAADLCTLATCPHFGFAGLPGSAARIDGFDQFPFDSESGLVLHVSPEWPSASPRDVKFNLRVRDMSRLASTLGTEIPVPRGSDFRGSTVVLLNIPVSAGYRTTVRVYSLDQTTSTINAIARVFDFSGSRLLEVPFQLQRTTDSSGMARSPEYYPLYARLDHMTDALPSPAPERVIIEITATEANRTIWGFASVTNNETQQLTVVAPD